MRGLPDLSAMMAGELGLSRAEPLVPPSELVTDDVNLATSDHRESSLVVAAAPKKKKSKKRAHDEPPVDDDRETLPEGADRSEGAEPPTKKRKKKKRLSLEDSVTGRDSGIASPPAPSDPTVGPSLNLALADETRSVSPEVPLQKKKLKQTSEQGTTKRQVSPVAISSNPGTSVPGPSTGGIPVVRKTLRVEFPDRVSFEYDGPTPLIYAPHKCAELVSQIKCGPKPFPPVADLIFKDEYVDAAPLAESEKLKKTVVSKSRLLRRRKAEWQEEFERMAEKRDRAVARRKAQKKRADAAEEELSVARSTVEALELRKANLMEEIGAKAAEHKKELDRLRDSRIYEVTKERVRVETEMIAKSNKHFGNLREWWTRCGPFDTARCLEALKAGGRDIPQETIDMFAAREKQFEEEALKLDPGEIPETDLILSPLRLES
ncbi:hypothetical protein Bca52824_064494 [Brassica carinata]|uniref:Uncharacterized protein n=1 Tax=Brassica carinata TaxID=52824 RepID=A0A8X7U963_BRACI|nr:hypothetical protein Bca52824_064494 [Brassica carinata]